MGEGNRRGVGLMRLNRPLAALLAALLLILGCSKTEDVAPERRIFGDPPKIINFTIRSEPGGDPAMSPQLAPAEVECDYTEIIETRLCTFAEFLGCTQCQDLRAISPVLIGGFYTQVIFEAEVDDPNSTREGGVITQSNLLLVSASFVLPNTTSETTLVLFNDGRANKFPQQQVSYGFGDDCGVDGSGACFCQGAIYLLDSNDPTKEVVGNEIFTRGFAFINNNTSAHLQNCIMREKHQVPYPLPPGSPLKFRIDAVDRQGNLDTWPKDVEVISGQDTFTCKGDPCGCCWLVSSDPLSDCRGLDGMLSQDGSFEFCKDGF